MNNGKLKMEKNFVSVVIHIKNHEKYIEYFFKNIFEILSKNFEKYEIVFVNNNSKDQTIAIIKKISSKLNNSLISIVNLSYEQDLESAMLAGIDIAIGDFVFEFDSPIIDYSFENILDIYMQSLKGYDIVSASPKKGEKLTSKIFYKIFKKYSSNNLQLSTESFRILSRRAINRINMLSNTIPYRKVLYLNCGLKTFSFKYNPLNKKLTNRINKEKKNKLELGINLLLLFTKFGYKISLYMSFFMFFISLSMGGYALFLYFFYKKIVEGWTTTMLFLSIGFTGLFLLIAIVVKYLSLILNIQQSKISYIYESVEKLKQ